MSPSSPHQHQLVVLSPHLIQEKTKQQNLTTIKRLNIWNAELTDVSILEACESLQVLSLSVNRIKTLKPFRFLYNLKELYLRNNEIASLRELNYLKPLKQLHVLWLCGNPCSTERNYRIKVIATLPNISRLDSQEVTQQERDQAAKWTRQQESRLERVSTRRTTTRDESLAPRRDNGDAEQSDCNATEPSMESHDKSLRGNVSSIRGGGGGETDTAEAARVVQYDTRRMHSQVTNEAALQVSSKSDADAPSSNKTAGDDTDGGLSAATLPGDDPTPSTDAQTGNPSSTDSPSQSKETTPSQRSKWDKSNNSPEENPLNEAKKQIRENHTYFYDANDDISFQQLQSTLREMQEKISHQDILIRQQNEKIFSSTNNGSVEQHDASERERKPEVDSRTQDSILSAILTLMKEVDYSRLLVVEQELDSLKKVKRG